MKILISSVYLSFYPRHPRACVSLCTKIKVIAVLPVDVPTGEVRYSRATVYASPESTRLAVGADVAFVLLELDDPLEVLLARNATRQSDLPVEVPGENVAWVYAHMDPGGCYFERDAIRLC